MTPKYNPLFYKNKKHTDLSCCGCSSCASICPRECITMSVDSEGFSYPEFSDPGKCVNCGLCASVCPVLYPYTKKSPLGIYAYKNPCDAVRFKSSSGGFFYHIASYVILHGGVVFGVKYDKDWTPVYASVYQVEDIIHLQGSKYAQASTFEVYPKVKEYLEGGRIVLFTGTPCQISGLKHYLVKDYPLLYTVDVVCHAVPSPKVWRSYLDCVSKGKSIRDINMRDKSTGWSYYKYSCRIDFTDGSGIKQMPGDNHFMKGFTSDLYNRLSCSTCKSKNGASGSDLTIGDFWGIWDLHKQVDDNRGVSLILANTEKGVGFVKQDKTLLEFTDYKEIMFHNKGLTTTLPHPNRHIFFKEYENSNKDFCYLVDRYLCMPSTTSFFSQMKLKLRRILKSIKSDRI